MITRRDTTASSATLLQSIGFKCALVMVFLRFSFLHETFTFLTGVNTYVLYIFGPLALISALASGGFPKTWREKAGKSWILLSLWMVAATPFSSWLGGSVAFVFSYWRTNLPMLFIASGCGRTWKDCRRMMYVVAAAALVTLATAHYFVSADQSGRLALSWGGTIANSNDLAAHLLMVLPFLLFIVIRPGTILPLRILFAGAIAVGMYQVLHTGSRGALIAIGATVLYVLFTGNSKQRVAVMVLAPLSFLALITILPRSTWQRLMSFSASDTATSEAIESAEARQYLLRQSLVYTAKHPVFGVGPGQFSSFEGSSMSAQGLRGNWHETHNSFTQVSSECGVPGLVFYACAIWFTFQILRKIKKRAEENKDRELSAAAFCLSVSLIGYCIATSFVNFAYHFYLLAFTGLVIAIWYAVRGDVPDPKAKTPPSPVAAHPLRQYLLKPPARPEPAILARPDF